MFGSNDRQQMKISNERLAVRSESWEKTYVERVDGMVDTLKVYGRPFFWVSAPPMRTPAVSGDMAYLNGLYKARVEAAGGTFVDIWNGFTNEDGQYIASGPDIDGQTRALRTPDGVNFTRAGRLKLSFYVEREIRRKTGTGFGTVDLACLDQQPEPDRGRTGRQEAAGRSGHLAVRSAAWRKRYACRRAGAARLRSDHGRGEGRRSAAIARRAKAPPVAPTELIRDRVIVKGESMPASPAASTISPGRPGATSPRRRRSPTAAPSSPPPRRPPRARR